MNILLAVVAISALLQQQVSALSSGAPSTACNTLSPDPGAHGAQPRTSDVPYGIDLSQFCSNGTYSYYPGQTYTRKHSSQCL